MKPKVYFCGSIRGGREDAVLYQEMIEEMKKCAVVLTEHVGDGKVHLLEDKKTDSLIYHEDMEWLRSSDLLIAECTTPSLGVGYEIACGENLGKQIYILYRKDKVQLSAMLSGNLNFHIFPYEQNSEALSIIREILEKYIK